jgi:hypothetical protein
MAFSAARQLHAVPMVLPNILASNSLGYKLNKNFPLMPDNVSNKSSKFRAINTAGQGKKTSRHYHVINAMQRMAQCFLN